jgi:hypothetical protein
MPRRSPHALSLQTLLCPPGTKPAGPLRVAWSPASFTYVKPKAK